MAQESGAKNRRGRGIMLPGLARARADAGYSIRGLQEASGVPRSTISLIERGRSGAQSRTVRRLAEALGVETRALTRDPAEALAAAPSREEIGRMVAEARAESGRTGEPLEDVLARTLEGYSGGSASAEAPRPKKPLGTPRAARPWFQEPLAAAAVSEDRGER